MAFLTRDFLDSRKEKSRYKVFALGIGIFLLVAGTAAAGFYLYEKEEADKTARVAGTVTATSVLSKDWLMKYFANDNENDPSIGGPYGDPDNDVLTNLQEYLFGSNPTIEDTDGDGEIDSFEVAFGRNPNGPGDLQINDTTKDYVRQYLAGREEYADFTEDKIKEQVEQMFKPDRAVVLDLPQDKELEIINQNDVAAFEKYFEETKGLSSADDTDLQNIQQRLFSDMTAEELDAYIAKLAVTIEVLKQTPVPSELLTIHKMKIAGLKSGVRMFELVRDNYNPAQPSEQFWSDFFYQIMAAEQAGILESVAWAEIGQRLKDQGGL